MYIRIGGFIGASEYGMAQKATSTLLDRRRLSKIKRKAIRAGVWFRVLHRIDRVLVDLTIKVAKNICSTYLANRIFVIIGKLERIIDSQFHRLSRTVGRELAEKTSQIAQNWGNLIAKRWSTDWSFALYLAMLQANK